MKTLQTLVHRLVRLISGTFNALWRVTSGGFLL